jgi:YaiO family outer membrane protein
MDTTLIYTPNAAVIKKYSAQIWSHHDLSKGRVLGIGFNTTVYPTSGADVQTNAVMTELEQYLGQYRFAYRLTATNVNIPSAPSQILFSHLFTSAYYYNDKSNVSITLATGRELENNGTPTPPVSQINAISIRQVHHFNNSWQSVVGLNWHRQGDLYIRSGISMGVAYGY